jgi:hypothetical protein
MQQDNSTHLKCEDVLGLQAFIERKGFFEMSQLYVRWQPPPPDLPDVVIFVRNGDKVNKVRARMGAEPQELLEIEERLNSIMNSIL